MAEDITVVDDCTLSNSFLGATTQICVVTHDLKRSLAGFVKLGIGPWRIYTFGPHNCTDMTYRGKAQPYSMRLALAWTGGSMWEVIQPLEGDSIYKEWLETHGEGVQHVVQSCPGMDYDTKVAEFRERGLEVIQSGLWHDIQFAYLGSEDLIGVVIEISRKAENPTKPQPEEWYPAAPAA